MSLLQLPPELFLAILQDLPEEDKQCLRIACRSLRGFIAPPIGVDVIRCEFSRLKEYWNKLSFLDRLTRLPGDLFSNKDAHLCYKCLAFRPSSRFPMLHTFSVGYDDDKMCETCIFKVLIRDTARGDRRTLRGVSYYGCELCGVVQPEKVMWWHCCHGSSALWVVCSDCHWPRDQHSLDFCKGCRQGLYVDADDISRLARCGCDECHILLCLKAKAWELKKHKERVALEADVDYCTQILAETELEDQARSTRR